MLYPTLVVVLGLSFASCGVLQPVLECLKKNCDFINNNQTYKKALQSVGMTTTTCNLPVGSGNTNSNCTIVPPNNVGFICTISADNLTVPTFSDKTFCYFQQLKKFNATCDQSIDEFINEFLIPDEEKCSAQDKELNPKSYPTRRRRGAARLRSGPGFYLTF